MPQCFNFYASYVIWYSPILLSCIVGLMFTLWSSTIGMKSGRPEESIAKKESPRKQAHCSLGKEAVGQTKFQSEVSWVVLVERGKHIFTSKNVIFMYFHSI